jgi:hypothetical protein
MRARAQQVRDSMLTEYRRRAGAAALPRQSKAGAPFYEYTWAFYASAIVGVLVGLTAVRLRRRDEPTARRAWMLVGALAGGAGAASVFFCVFVFNAIMSIGFSSIPAAGMFGFTLFLVVACGLGVSFAPRRF